MIFNHVTHDYSKTIQPISFKFCIAIGYTITQVLTARIFYLIHSFFFIALKVQYFMSDFFENFENWNVSPTFLIYEH